MSAGPEAQGSMTCSEFVEHFSDIHDGVAPADLVSQAEEHARSCPACRRYRHVLEQGVEVLRALPAPEVHEDFAPRLQHRLFHVDQEAALRSHATSGTTAAAVLGMAVLLAVVAWAPALSPGAPVVELPPIVVSGPPPARGLPPSAFSAFAARPSSNPLEAGLWGDARTLLFEYSRLARGYGQSPAVGAGDPELGR